MKHVLLLIPTFMLTAVIGCSERGYVAPHIVSIDPPIQEFTKEEMLELASEDGPLPFPLPRRYVHLNRAEYTTVTVTFSAPPEELIVRASDWRRWTAGRYDDVKYHLRDRTLEATVFCYSTPNNNYYSPTHFSRLTIEWKGGGQYIQFWCLPEEEE